MTKSYKRIVGNSVDYVKVHSNRQELRVLERAQDVANILTSPDREFKNKSIKILCIPLGIVILILLAISIALTIFANMDILSSLRVTFGSLYVLFIPGFIISYIFFPRTKEFKEDSGNYISFSPESPMDISKKASDKINRNIHDEKDTHKGSIDWIERIALSFALSIAIVSLVVFYLNLVGIKINLLNSFLTILGIIIVSLGILAYKNKKH